MKEHGDAKLLEGLAALLRSLRTDELGEPKPPDREAACLGNLGQQKEPERKRETGTTVQRPGNVWGRERRKNRKECCSVWKGFLEAAKRGQIGRRSTEDREEQDNREEGRARASARKETSKEQEQTQPRRTTRTLRFWEGAWPKDALISHFKLKPAWKRKKTSAHESRWCHRVPCVSCKPWPKPAGTRTQSLPLVLADVAKTSAGHKVILLELHVKDKAPLLRKAICSRW